MYNNHQITVFWRSSVITDHDLAHVSLIKYKTCFDPSVINFKSSKSRYIKHLHAYYISIFKRIESDCYVERHAV